jgi:hypothetical protein
MVQFRIMDPVWSFLGRTMVKTFIYAGLGLSLLYQGYQVLTPDGETPGLMRQNLAERICAQVARDLPKMEGMPSLAVLDLAGDKEGFLSNILREKIIAAERYRILDESFFRKLMREAGRAGVPVSNLEDAIAAARQIGVDLILFGEVPEYDVTEKTGTLKVELRMAERSTGQAVFVRTYKEEAGGDLVLNSYWRARIAGSSKGRRIFIWVVAVLLLPLATLPLIRRLTSEESNALNLVMLLGYTILDMFLALLLTGVWIPTIWTAAILVLALAGSGYYNYLVASFVERMNH